MTSFVTQSMEGVDLGATYAAISAATPEYPGLPFAPGSRVIATDGSEWIFVTASGTIAQNAVCWIDNTYAAVVAIGGAGAITAVPEATAGFVGFCQVAGVVSGVSFWAMISGRPTVLVASAGVTVPLYTSDTAGTLTGTTNTASHFQVMGVTCVVTASGSTASATLTVANFPSIRKPVA